MLTLLQTTVPMRAIKGALLASLISLGAGAASAETLRLLTPWNTAGEGTYAVEQVLHDAIKEASGGEISLQRFDPSVVPPFEQLEPVSSGVFDLHYTSPAYHAGDTGAGQVADTVVSDPTARRESGLWDEIDRRYGELNLKLIALSPSTGFQFFLRNPVAASGDLAGLKVRSNPAYDGTIRDLGGTPVQLPLSEIYTGLEKGLIDGTAFPSHGVASSKMWEVAPYMVRPTFGQGTFIVLMNLDKWNSLSDEAKGTWESAGRLFEERAFEVISGVAERDEKTMLENGAEISQLGEAAADRINLRYNEAIWEQMVRNGGEGAQELVDFVKNKDLVFNGQ